MRTVADLVAAQEDPNVERALRIRIPRALLERLPSQPGVFQLESATGACLFVSRTNDVRHAVAHMFFGASHLSDRQLRMLSETVGVEASITSGELEARVLEAEWVRKRRPEYNRSDRHLPKGFFVRLVRRGIHPRLVVASRISRDGDLYVGPIKGRAFADEAVVALSRAFDLPRATVEEPTNELLASWNAAAHELEAALCDDGKALRARMESQPDGHRERCLAAIGRLSKLRRGDRSWLANRPDAIVVAPTADGAVLAFFLAEGVCQRYSRIQTTRELARFISEVRRALTGALKRVSVLHADVSTILAHALRNREEADELVVMPIDEADRDASLSAAEVDVAALLTSAAAD